MLIAPLTPGPLDVVGDIHGELGELTELLAVLGYDREGAHRDGRHLVFVGDLCDRGPDSPGVIELVRGLVEHAGAQCVLGNHELNLLRGSAKHGNRWFLDPAHAEQRGEFAHCATIAGDRAADTLAFLAARPLVLERADLRVVHAAWHAPAIAALRARNDQPVMAVYDEFQRAIGDELAGSGLARAADAEARAYADALEHEATPVPLLADLAARDELIQMGNPIRVTTSGVERQTTVPFWANGKWRMVDRVTWWDDYREATPVIVGHYWRLAADPPAASGDVSGGKPDLFDGYAAADWLGPAARVFCIDFSIGGRYRERARGATSFVTRLGAMRWPERDLVLVS